MIYDTAYFEENDYFQKFMDTYRKNPNMRIFLWGAGGSLGDFIKILNRFSIPISGIIDGQMNSNETCEKYGIEVRTPESMKKLCPGEAIIIITSLKFRKEIRKIIETDYSPWQMFEFAPSLDNIQDNLPTHRKQYLISYSNELESMRRSLEDDLSKQTLDNYIKFCISDNPDWCEETATNINYFHPFICEVLDRNEVFVDVGAFIGDTIQEFLNIVKDHYKYIYAFEADSRNCNLLNINVGANRIKVINKCLGEKSGKCFFLNETSDINGEAHMVENDIDDRVVEMEQTALDEENIGEVTFIKMDIEGAEMQALLGAEQSIRANRPKLAICVYHKINDILDIYHWIDNLNLGYKIYLRHPLNCGMSDLVLFAL